MVAVLSMGIGLNLQAQDTTNVSLGDTIILAKPHSAKKASILSALAPGAGQIYNKKYWKAPIVWGGLGVCVYFIQENRSFYRSHLNEAKLRQNDINHVSTLTYRDLETFSNATDAIVSDEDLLLEVDKRKRWLDLSYFSLIAVYGLNILDANVDGHLFNYDISPDISMEVRPSTIFRESPKAGLSLTLKF